jgi:4-deoxy-L-threo-5-hexosulose-uronate ketol-isomerase
MRIIHQVHPEDFVKYNTQQIREKFLLDKLVAPNSINCAYTHYDRMIIGTATPSAGALKLVSYDALKSENFLDRREIGIINIAGTGSISVDGENFILDKLDCLYIGRGKKDVVFAANENAKFVFFSCPAHAEHPTQLMKAVAATPAEMGSAETANHRTINKYIHTDGLKSCQLMLGVTNFKAGSIWNTMPPHLHDRRMEAYFYFDLPETQRVIHFMGEPHETRHLFLNNEEGIVSPSWSIHSGVATAAYSFIWAMAGENISFTDMDAVNIKSLQ